jgi:hypothetical protein
MTTNELLVQPKLDYVPVSEREIFTRPVPLAVSAPAEPAVEQVKGVLCSGAQRRTEVQTTAATSKHGASEEKKEEDLWS